MRRTFLYLRLTNRCNLRCPHCYIPDYKGDMSLDIVKRAFEYFSDRELTVSLHGGEPILVGKRGLFNVLELFNKQRKHSDTIYIQTNLHYDVESFIDFFKTLDGVGTSMDEGRDNKVLYKNIDRLLEEGIDIHVNITLTDAYIDSGKFSEDIKFIESRGVGFRIEPYVYVPGKISLFNYRRYMEIVDEYMKHPLYTAKHTVCGVNKVVIGGNCAKDGLRVVDADGEVYICPNLAGYKMFSIGNIMDDSFSDDLRINKLGMKIFHERAKQIVLKTDCGNCQNFAYCEGGCVANNIFKNWHKLKREEDYILVKNPYCEEVRWFYQGES